LKTSWRRSLVALAVALSGCASVPPAPPIPPPVTVAPTIAFDLTACADLPTRNTCPQIAGATFQLETAPGVRTVVTPNPGTGYVVVTAFPDVPATRLIIAAQDFDTLTIEGLNPRALARNNLEPFAGVETLHNFFVLTRSHVALPRLVAEGTHFRLATGGRITIIGHSDFHLLGRFLSGEDIRPILQQRHDAGYNALRVWTRYQLSQYGIGDSTLAMHPDLYVRVPAFLQLAARYGFYVELTAYSGREDYDPTHWDRLIAAVRDETNVLLELVNENDQAGNRLPNLALFARPPPPVLASHGSNGSQQTPVEPFWSYADFHTNDAPEEQRKVGHNAWEIWGGPTVTWETSRYPDVGMWRGASLERAKQLAFDSGAGAALLAAGWAFHSTFGKNSTLWDADAIAVAKAGAEGSRSVNLACQDGPYVHRIDLETAGLLRVYERPVSGVDCGVRIRK